MIFHDRIAIAALVSRDPPEYDEFGEEIKDTITLPSEPAEVTALDSTEVLAAGGYDKVMFLETRYRVMIPPTVGLADIDLLTKDAVCRIGWGPYQLNATDPFESTSGLRGDGAVIRHYRNGRLHHYELITKNIG